jgi:hypothetical protein
VLNHGRGTGASEYRDPCHPLAGGCFLFCTRAAFDAVGGFDETLFAAEEGVMSRRLARVAVSSSSARP